jgi:hypothetical protein
VLERYADQAIAVRDRTDQSNNPPQGKPFGIAAAVRATSVRGGLSARHSNS